MNQRPHEVSIILQIMHLDEQTRRQTSADAMRDLVQKEFTDIFEE